MRKTLLCAAALAAGLATSVAQNVYSLNVVGYYNVTVPAGQFKMIANQLVQTNSTVPVLFAGVPGGTQILKWTGTAFQPNSYDAEFAEWGVPGMTLVPGEGAFIKNTSVNPLTVTFVGEVNQQTNAIAFTADVFKMASLFTPQGGNLASDFGFPAGGGDQILRWNGTAYTPSSYDAEFAEWSTPPVVAVGEGFFVKTKTTKTWTRSFKVQ